MSYRVLLAAALLCCAAFGARCSSPDDDDAMKSHLLLAILAGNPQLHMAARLNVDLAGSRGLLVGGSSGAAFNAAAPVSSGARLLYNLNNANQLEVVRIFEGAAGAAPRRMYNLADYVVFDFSGAAMRVSCLIVVARKSDRALFCAHTPWPAGYGSLYADKLAQPRQDAAGNLYLNAHIAAAGSGQPNVGVLWRLSPESSGMTRTLWVDPADFGATSMGGFAVNPANSAVLFSFYDGTARIKNSAGGLSGVSSGSMPAVWFAPNGNFYVFSINGSNTNRQLNGLNFAASDSMGAVHIGGGWANDRTICSTAQNTYVVKGDDSLYQLTDAAGFSNNVFSLAGVQQFDQVRCSDSSVFVLARNNVGDSLLARFDAAGGAFTTLLAAGGYVVASYDANSAGEITFGGVRNADGAKVLATIPAAGGPPQITSISTPDVSELIRLN